MRVGVLLIACNTFSEAVQPVSLIDVCLSFSIESHYVNTTYLEVHCQPGVLMPGQLMEVDILFYPREAKRYHQIIPFEINGLSTVNVEVSGEGTDMKVKVHYVTTNIFATTVSKGHPKEPRDLLSYLVCLGGRFYFA